MNDKIKPQKKVTGTPPPNPLPPTPPPEVLNNITNQPVNFENILNNLSIRLK
jgi:hypothetical protein